MKYCASRRSFELGLRKIFHAETRSSLRNHGYLVFLSGGGFGWKAAHRNHYGGERKECRAGIETTGADSSLRRVRKADGRRVEAAHFRTQPSQGRPLFHPGTIDA